LQHITHSSMRHIEHHVVFAPPNPNLQGVGGVCLGPTLKVCFYGFWIQPTNLQEINELGDRSKNVWITCHFMCPLLKISLKKFENSTQFLKYSLIVCIHV
jgi:hypothetical protein